MDNIKQYVGDIDFASSRKVGTLINNLCKAKLVFGSVIGKNQKAGNKTRFSFDYADLPSVNVLTTSVLAHYNLAIVNLPIVMNGKCIYRVRLYHPSEQWLQASCPLLLDDITSQKMGSAMSYARRYLKLGLLDIAAVGEDDDGHGSSAEQLKNQQKKINKFLKLPENEFLNALEENETDGENGESDTGETEQDDTTETKETKKDGKNNEQ